MSSGLWYSLLAKSKSSCRRPIHVQDWSLLRRIVVCVRSKLRHRVCTRWSSRYCSFCLHNKHQICLSSYQNQVIFTLANWTNTKLWFLWVLSSRGRNAVVICLAMITPIPEPFKSFDAESSYTSMTLQLSSEEQIYLASIELKACTFFEVSKIFQNLSLTSLTTPGFCWTKDLLALLPFTSKLSEWYLYYFSLCS